MPEVVKRMEQSADERSMTLHAALREARSALAKRDYAAAESAAKLALNLAGVERFMTGRISRLSEKKAEQILEAALVLARALLEQGKWLPAQRVWWPLAGLDGRRLVPLKLLAAEAHFQAGDWHCDLPLQTVSELLQERPEAGWTLEIYLAQAKFNRFQGYYELADRALRKAVAIYRKMPEEGVVGARLSVERGLLELDWKENLAQARKHLERALVLDAANTDARAGMGDVELEEGRPEVAMNWLLPLEHGNDPAVIASIGWCYAESDAGKADEYFHRAVTRAMEWHGKFHPFTGLMLFQLGLFRLQQKRRDEARDLLEHSLATWRSTLQEEHPWVAGVKDMLVQFGPHTERVYVSPLAEQYEEMRRRLKRLKRRLPAISPEVAVMDLQRPATLSSVVMVERALGRRLPESFRDALLGFSAAVRIMFYEQSRNISGWLVWNVEDLLAVHQQYLRMEDITLAGELWRPWANRLAFLAVANGDYVTIDLSSEDGAVLYFDHEGMTPEGVVLASNFGEFLRRVVYLGGVGDYSYRVFLGKDGLDIESAAAREWHAFLYGKA